MGRCPAPLEREAQLSAHLEESGRGRPSALCAFVRDANTGMTVPLPFVRAGGLERVLGVRVGDA
jgi:hypothetical protein